MAISLDRENWVRAGGDPLKLDLYAGIGKIAPFSDGADRCLASIHPALPQVGAVGDWVGGRDVLLAAETWLALNGCRCARGPLELCTWFPYRVNLGPWDQPPFAFEPTEEPDRWTKAGYQEVAAYFSALAEHDRQIAASRDHVASLSAAGWSLEPLRADRTGLVPEASFRSAIAAVHRISGEAFAEAFGYAPIPEEALQTWYAPYREKIDPRLVLFVRSPDGETAGFLFSVPDFAQPQRGWFLVKTLAISPRFRDHGLGTWLVAASHQIARRAGYKAGVHALMWSDSHSNDISRHGGRILRRYALLEKAL